MRAPLVEDRLYRIRHSASHMMAQAVLELFPDAKLAIGPPTADGFYYDFDLPRPLTPEDLLDIEASMARQVTADYEFRQEFWPKEQAVKWFSDRGQKYKLELIEGLPEAKVGIYRHGDFTDLCKGPHVERTSEVKAFKLLSVAGAYWRGDENREVLQRIYGTAFESQQELDDHLHRLEEAKKRDHRKLGKELDLFFSSPEIGAGLPILLPKGATVRRLLEDFILKAERERGYLHVRTPDLAKVELYKTSGHYEYYKDAMYPFMELDNEELVLRPMNCPHHFMVYKSDLRSYRDLPLRIGELGQVYRYEKSGVLGGLMRVRGFTINDAHIFCQPEKLKEEILGCIELTKYCYEALNLTDFWYRLSLPDLTDRAKYGTNIQMWEKSEAILREALDEASVPYQPVEGEAAFYGPKIDLEVRDVLGRDFTASTVQVDLLMPERFNLTYVAEDGTQKAPIVIHRAPIGSFERMMAILIEHYAGAFPSWLAPIQVRLIPITDSQRDFAQAFLRELQARAIRAEIDGRSERTGKKIRDGELAKIPYLFILGTKEQEASQDSEMVASVRARGQGDLGQLRLSEFLAKLQAELPPGAPV